jgi:hypothetical protein
MENPLAPDEIHQKYLKLATSVVTTAHAERIAETVARIEGEEDVEVLATLLRSPKAPVRAARQARRAR